MKNSASSISATTTTVSNIRPIRHWKSGHEGQKQIGLWVEYAFLERLDKTRKGTDMSRQRFMRMLMDRGLDQIDAE